MQLTKSEVNLAEIAPEILKGIDQGVRVVIVSTTVCPRCDQTIRLLAKKNVVAVKHTIENRLHPVLVALRAHLGLDPDAPVALPGVFVDGIYRWHDLNAAAISALAKEFEEAADVAA